MSRHVLCRKLKIYDPTVALAYGLGAQSGVKAQAEACKDSWEKILQFLARWSQEEKSSVE